MKVQKYDLFCADKDPENLVSSGEICYDENGK